ncbi:MAG: substrate-binding domain-containing protein [Granulosicoccus sp.]|nr:substrate-binding domain-containing protein [Granulosicoccus sp.]
MRMNLKQLSAQLGLSQTTVSRALNGYPEVSEHTRIRVQRAAEAGNYRPNARASSLATGRAMTIGHVIPVASQNDVINPIFSEFVAAASKTYSLNGYELLLKIAPSEDEESTYRTLAAKRAVDGVILHSPKCHDSRIALLKEIGLPFVSHGRVLDAQMDYSWVDMDSEDAFTHATKLLLDLGHQRIALLNGMESMTFAWLRRQGYLTALANHGVSVDETLMAANDLTEPYGYQSASRMLARADRPSAFLVSSYIVALGVRRAITEADLIIGKDISVVIHDDELSYFDNSDDVPQFTSTRSSVREAGHLAAEMLLEQIENPTKSPVSQMVPTQLVVGASTGPCPN